MSFEDKLGALAAEARAAEGEVLPSGALHHAALARRLLVGRDEVRALLELAWPFVPHFAEAGCPDSERWEAAWRRLRRGGWFRNEAVLLLPAEEEGE